MFLSDVMNNAATAAILYPSPLALPPPAWRQSDSFLMAVAIGASCAFSRQSTIRTTPDP
jgi:di/tricarboxylate transporter